VPGKIAIGSGEGVMILLCVDAAQCYDGKAGGSLSKEARSKNNEANNAEGGSALECFGLRKDPLQKANHAGIVDIVSIVDWLNPWRRLEGGPVSA
jgi:hypothetical protein